MEDKTKWAEFQQEIKKVTKARNKVGRPKVDAKIDIDSPLFAFPGRTKQEQLAQLYERWYACERCFLGEHREAEGCGSDIVFFRGNPNADILLVGEAPGEQEEKTKEPFVGASGQLLNQIIGLTTDDPEIQAEQEWYNSVAHTKVNQDRYHKKLLEYRFNEFGITNVVSCRPPDNRAPTLEEMKKCWERLWNIIYITDPMLIMTFGATALAAVTRKTSALVTKVRGQVFDVSYYGMVGDLTYPVMPLLHPSFLMRSADYKTKDGNFQKTVRDFKSGLHMVDFLRNVNYGTPIPKR
jgi:uracil-DNA glycosylase family 4